MVRKVSTYIETHLDAVISSADLARLAKESMYHFCRAFRESFDESPHKYVMRRRIERAKGLMLQTNLSLAQIALNAVWRIKRTSINRGVARGSHRFNERLVRYCGRSLGSADAGVFALPTTR